MTVGCPAAGDGVATAAGGAAGVATTAGTVVFPRDAGGNAVCGGAAASFFCEVFRSAAGRDCAGAAGVASATVDAGGEGVAGADGGTDVVCVIGVEGPGRGDGGGAGAGRFAIQTTSEAIASPPRPAPTQNPRVLLPPVTIGAGGADPGAEAVIGGAPDPGVGAGTAAAPDAGSGVRAWATAGGAPECDAAAIGGKLDRGVAGSVTSVAGHGVDGPG